METEPVTEAELVEVAVCDSLNDCEFDSLAENVIVEESD